MLSERVLKIALKQTALMVAVLVVIPVTGVMATLLLATITALFCDQLQGLMILSVIATSVTLVVQEFRRSNKA